MTNRYTPRIAGFIDSFFKTCMRQPAYDNDYPASAEPADAFLQWTQKEYENSCYQMKINHTGEICAQALYAGHVNSHQSNDLYEWLEQAKKEEYAHLQWCSQRLGELGSRSSYADPFFYAMSYAIAKTLSILSPAWNLQFIAETERQVQEHLESQINLLKHDSRSCKIIEQMILEERAHQEQAELREPRSMPAIPKKVMKFCATAMKIIVKYI